MKSRARLFLICSTLLLGILACNLPGNTPTQDFPPTPNATMTELFARATILTPDLSTPEGSTATVTEQITSTFTEQPPAEPTPSFTVPPASTSANTPPPTVTNSTPQRPGTVYYARYLTTPPVMDGDWGEWTTTQYPANWVVYGLGSWEDGDDLESAFRIGWDNTYLFVAVKVRDDVYVQNATGQNIFQGDSIELLLDIDLYGDFNTTSLSADDYQLGISPGKGGTDGTKEAYLWYPTSATGSKSQVVIATVGESGVYRVEFAVPWSLLGVTPGVNKRFGFALSVSDNDDTANNVQQTMVSSASKRVFTNPTTWGELVLTN